MVYVTHDQVEAMTMADKIVVLNGGVIEQVGSPLELYHRPRNLFVAGFIGSPKMNFIKATGSPAKGGKINVELPGGAKLVLEGEAERVGAGGAVTLGVRPEHLSLDGAADATLTCKIRLAEYLGSESMFYGGLSDGSEIAVKAGGLAKADAGTALDVGIDVSSCHLFDSQGQAIVNGDLTR
jgi:multiple sugar transport system ATP-binding protein